MLTSLQMGAKDPGRPVADHYALLLCYKATSQNERRAPRSVKLLIIIRHNNKVEHQAQGAVSNHRVS